MVTSQVAVVPEGELSAECRGTCSPGWDVILGQLMGGAVSSQSSWADRTDTLAEGRTKRRAACRAGVPFGISSKFKFCFSDQLNLQRDLGAGREVSSCFPLGLWC